MLPGETLACYAGPDGTMDVGTCQAGLKTCDDDGQSFGPCVGEVVPTPESCVTVDVDDDCDGAIDCVGEIEWGRLFSSPAPTTASPPTSTARGTSSSAAW
ncbi:hypothetical protein [Nannocystis pusilla]|uniref:hypothetical protein n=1 Tax=Nannocystis pusilla TaxID=889268 RepID=UPI003B79F5B7